MRAHPRGTPTKATAPSPRAAYPGRGTRPRRSRRTGAVTALTPARTAQPMRLAKTRRTRPSRTARRSTRLRASRSPIGRPEPGRKPAPGTQLDEADDQQAGSDQLQSAPHVLRHGHSPVPQLPHTGGIPTGRGHFGCIILRSLIPWLCRVAGRGGRALPGARHPTGIRKQRGRASRRQRPARERSAGSRRPTSC